MELLAEEVSSLLGPIFVTGAAGFVGANLFKRLRSSRSDVFAVIRSRKGWRLEDVPDEQTIGIDLNDHQAARDLIDARRPRTVFHCAAYGAYSFEADANRIYLTNFQSVVNLVDRLASGPFSAFVHAGSSSEYGSNSAAPSEDRVCDPNSPYSVSKIAAASYLRFMGKHRDFPAVNLRLYSAYGPLEDTSRLLPALLRQASFGRLPPLVHPDTSRDFVVIDDVCDAFILAAAKIEPRLQGESLNIGTGLKTTIRDVVEVVRDAFALKVEPQFGSMSGRAWDLQDWYADPARARRELGWEPHTSLKEGLAIMASWIIGLTDEQMTSATSNRRNPPVGSPATHN